MKVTATGENCATPCFVLSLTNRVNVMILLPVILVLTVMNNGESCVWQLVVVCREGRISFGVFGCRPPRNALSHLNPWADVHVVQSDTRLVLVYEGDRNKVG